MRAFLTIFLLGGLLVGLLTLAACDSLLVVGYVATNDSDDATESDSSSSDSGLRNVKGSAENPWPVDTLAELQSIAVGFQNEELAEPLSLADSLAGHYVLTANIDASPTASGEWQQSIDDNGTPEDASDDIAQHGFLPIGSCGADSSCVTDEDDEKGDVGQDDSPFSGGFDGAGFTISGLHVARSSASEVGLFGLTSGAVLQNLTLREVNVNGRRFVGGLVGFNHRSSVSESSVGGTLDCEGSPCRVGGLVGYQRSGTVHRGSSTSSARCVGESCSAGSLIGTNKGTVQYSEASGYASCVRFFCAAGGLIGANHGTARHSRASGPATSTHYAGGLIGANHGAVHHSHATSSVGGDASFNGGFSYYAGGLVGINEGIVRNSYAIGSVGGATTPLQDFSHYSGGLVARNFGTVEDSFAASVVDCALERCSASGLVDLNNGGIVRRSFAAGPVRCSGKVCRAGGLMTASYKNAVREHAAVAENNFATGDVSCQAEICSAAGLITYKGESSTQNSFASGDVSSQYVVGGLIGSSDFYAVQDVLALGQASCFGEYCDTQHDETSRIPVLGAVLGVNYESGILQRAYYRSDAYDDNPGGVGSNTGAEGIGTVSGVVREVSGLTEAAIRALTCEDAIFRWDHDGDDPDGDGLLSEPASVATPPQDCVTAGAADFPWDFGTNAELPVLNEIIGGVLDAAGQRALVAFARTERSATVSAADALVAPTVGRQTATNTQSHAWLRVSGAVSLDAASVGTSTLRFTEAGDGDAVAFTILERDAAGDIVRVYADEITLTVE